MRVVFVALFLLLGMGVAQADTTALSGTVSSSAEGKMEGVLVSATKTDNTITVTVVSDAQGRYRFPATKLAPGSYTLDIRAIGYVLGNAPSVTFAAGKTAQADLRLAKAPDLAAQLTNTEWLESMPGSDTDKRALLECQSCHTVDRIVHSTHSSDEFVQVLDRMANYANNSTPLHPQKRVALRTPKADLVRAAANYLATINLSTGPHWSYALKTLPRPKGAATHVVITEYHLPRASMAPHDVLRDKDGIIWFSEFGDPAIGALDPKTGKVTEYHLPSSKPNFPTGTLDLEPDGKGDYWLALMFQTGLAKFDTRTKTFQIYPIPVALNSDSAQQSMVMPKGVGIDGKVWTNMVNRQSVMRMDLATGAFELIDPFASTPPGSGVEHSPYGMVVDGKNDLYFMDFGDTNIVRIDAKTLDPTIYPTPTPASRPRRGMIDAQGHIWFAEFAGDRIGRFETKSGKFREFPLPDRWTSPYDAAIDKEGKVWSGGMSSDRVQRLDPATGKVIEYLLPHQTNIRRVFIDNSTPHPTFWAGNNHHAAIIKLELTE
ncbi:MAG TPA: carboxypeptidase regulatory-like domain-containing protein [Stellaceae bacterium]|jgi:streptogramin lyase|nr:carboxypeptidase regulatory-like domain-containing protein [Stellaceae bacterium]